LKHATTKGVSEPRFWRFAYLLNQRLRRAPVERFPLRDGGAFAEISAALYEQGYRFADTLINHTESDFSSVPFHRRDLVVVTTRIPLDDDRSDKKYIERTRTPFERLVHDAARRHLAVCRRPRITLQAEILPHLKLRDRGEIDFFVYGCGRYRRHRDPAGGHLHGQWKERGPKEFLTAGYVLRTPLWEDGPDLLAVFGVDGVRTHAWCYLVRKAFPQLLSKRGLTVAEILFVPPSKKPSTLEFAHEWKVDFLLEGAVPAPRPVAV